ncbi:IS3 family transposase [Rhodobacterales bacterium LSUCC0031]|nr:IS3 family transposase [Rhodobacterales bacterium LSUCC0031]
MDRPKAEFSGLNHGDRLVVLDKQFLEAPFYGVQQLTWHLRNEGSVVNYKRIRRLMRLMVQGTVAPVAPRKPRNDADPLPGSVFRRNAREGTRSPTPAGQQRSTRPTPICWVGCAWNGPIRSGAPTSPTSRCAMASSIWSRSWTGLPGRCWPGACPTPW